MEGEGGKMLLSSKRSEELSKTTKKVFGVSSGWKKEGNDTWWWKEGVQASI